MKIKNTIFPVALIILGSLPSKAQMPPQEVLDCGLRVVSISTINGEEPTCESINAPAGSWGVGITNVNKVPGSLTIYNPDGSVDYESGEYQKKESGMTIKVRGNTSARFAKKPYKIKLEKKADLLSRGDKDLRDKNWALISDNNMLQLLGYELGKWAGMAWAPAFEHVNVILNGTYRGLYLLVETVERGEACRIITSDTGFVAERDPYWWNENGEYLNSSWSPQYNWTMKYPDFEDLSEEQKTYIQATLSEFERIINTEDYQDMLDIESVARYLIAQNILGTSDGGGTNLYFAKYDDTPSSKLFIPCLWDTDSALEMETSWCNIQKTNPFSAILNSNNRAAKCLFVNLYEEIGEELWGKVWDLMQSLDSPEVWGAYEKGALLNNELWGESAVHTTSHCKADFDWWYDLHKPWLDGAILDLKETLGFNGTISDDRAIEESISLQGRRLTVDTDKPYSVFTPQGLMIYHGQEPVVELPESGLYIVKTRGTAKKVLAD